MTAVNQSTDDSRYVQSARAGGLTDDTVTGLTAAAFCYFVGQFLFQSGSGNKTESEAAFKERGDVTTPFI